MAYPEKYARQYDFQSYQNSNPTRPLPGDKVNADLNAVQESIDEIVDFIEGFSRSDGGVANSTIGFDQLTAAVQALLGDEDAVADVQAMADAAEASATAADTSADAAAASESAAAVSAAAAATSAGASATSASASAASAVAAAASAASVNLTKSGTPSAGGLGVWASSSAIKGVSLTGVVMANGASDPTVAGIGDTLTIGSIQLGHASDTTITRNAAGDILVEGVQVALNTTGVNHVANAFEVGHASDTTLSRASAGVVAVEGVSLYPGIPINPQSAAYPIVLADANTAIYHPSTDNNARTFTIPANGTIAFPVGTTLTFINEINTVTIAITTDTLTLGGSGSTGSRTLAANGMATAVKVASTKWMISGAGLT